MARFKKGQGGRPRGAKNKVTEQIRENFAKLVKSNLDKMANDLEELEPKERLKLIIELTKFIVPTLKSQELKTDLNEDKEATTSFNPIVINLNDKSNEAS